MSAPARLHPDDLVALAEMTAGLVVAALKQPTPDPASGKLITAAEVARRFGVSRRWVYDHADEVGAIPLGDGDKPRLRFDPERVKDALRVRETPRRPGSVARAVSSAGAADVQARLAHLPAEWRDAALSNVTLDRAG